MTRRRLVGFDYGNPDVAYFVTTRAYPRKSPFKDPRLATVVLDSLNWFRENREISIYSYCLMPDHLHMLMRLGDQGTKLGIVIGTFKMYTTKQCWKQGYTGLLWQQSFHDHNLRKSEHGRRIALYIRENPVRKGLVEDAEEYPWAGMPDPM